MQPSNGSRPHTTEDASPSAAYGPGPWRRSSSFEEQFLDAIARGAGIASSVLPQLRRDVDVRLAKGAREYGPDSYLDYDWPAEPCREEPADVIGWSMLGCQQLYLEQARGMPAETAEEIREQLVAMCVDAGRIWLRGQRVLELWGEYQAPRR